MRNSGHSHQMQQAFLLDRKEDNLVRPNQDSILITSY